MEFTSLERLVGQELTSVLVATNNIRLHFAKYPLLDDGSFNDSATVDIEYGFEIVHNDQVKIRSLQDACAVKFRYSAGELIQFIEVKVVSATSLQNENVEISFASGGMVRVLSSNDGFDSIHIGFKQK